MTGFLRCGEALSSVSPAEDARGTRSRVYWRRSPAVLRPAGSRRTGVVLLLELLGKILVLNAKVVRTKKSAVATGVHARRPVGREPVPRDGHHLGPQAPQGRVHLPLRALLLRARGQRRHLQPVLPVHGEQVREDQDCGAGPPGVRSYVPGRLVGDFPEASPEVNKWLKAAQYYVKAGREKKTALPKALREV